MAEFLLELFSEEIPARMQVKAAEDMKDLVTKGLTDKGLTFTKAESHSTPRRITVVIDGLPEQQPDTVAEKRGPRVDAPEQALQGFLKSVNQTNFDKCVKEESPKGTFWFYRENVKGAPTVKILPQVIQKALSGLHWPKSMHWADFGFPWVRPLHNILALFNGEVLPGGLLLGRRAEKGDMWAIYDDKKFDQLPYTLKFSAKSQGHRFLSNEGFLVSDFADYKAKLRSAHVLLSRDERKALITEQAQKLANKEGLKIRGDEGLLDEIVGLVEWPVPLVGTFEKEYLDVPQEVLISTMRGNQKYMALLDASGKLSNKFIVIANMITEDGGKQVVAGNEKVLRARLSDAKFYWDQDRRHPLESRLPALVQIKFHDQLGTVRERVDRLINLSGFCAKTIYPNDDIIKKDAERAASLCKADLTSGVVFQFPEVQGIMGRYYALHDGERPTVAQAIAEHYKPVGAGDTCPTNPVSICVALADKIDALAGFFAIGEKPTGSKDPFALRRAALGVIRIILDNKLRVSLNSLFDAGNFLLPLGKNGIKARSEIGAGKEIFLFFIERMKVALKDQGVRHDLIDAVFAARSDDDLVRVVARIHAIRNFLQTEDGANLVAAYKRAANILRIEEKKDGKAYSGKEVQEELLTEFQEKFLFKELLMSEVKIKADLSHENFEAVMSTLAALRKPIDHFFEKTLVNTPDALLRSNRLSMLASIVGTMNDVADFSKIEG